jgi:hypothetical protein
MLLQDRGHALPCVKTMTYERQGAGLGFKLWLYLDLQFDTYLLLAHCIPKIEMGSSLPMDSMDSLYGKSV